MNHWHVRVEGPGELHGIRSYPVRVLARAETERKVERAGSTTSEPRKVYIVSCDSEDCLGYPSPPEAGVSGGGGGG